MHVRPSCNTSKAHNTREKVLRQARELVPCLLVVCNAILACQRPIFWCKTTTGDAFRELGHTFAAKLREACGTVALQEHKNHCLMKRRCISARCCPRMCRSHRCTHQEPRRATQRIQVWTEPSLGTAGLACGNRPGPPRRTCSQAPHAGVTGRLPCPRKGRWLPGRRSSSRAKDSLSVSLSAIMIIMCSSRGHVPQLFRLIASAAN